MKRFFQRLLGLGAPDLTLRRPDGDDYLRRWWILPRSMTRWNVYHHIIVGSDEDRALHDHPAWNISIVLWGGYWEVTPDSPEGGYWRGVGSVVFRKADALHRLIIPVGGSARTLWISGVKARTWGFKCPDGRWINWKEFTGFGKDSETYTGVQPIGGPGCGEFDD